MGIFSKISSSFERSSYRGTCRAMIRAYNKVKQQNPNASHRELCAMALSFRPGWKKVYPFVFTNGEISPLGTPEILEIRANDNLRDVARNLILLETGLFWVNDASLDSFRSQGKVYEALSEEFKGFKK